MKYKVRFAAFFTAMVVFNLAANFAHPVTPTVIQELNLHDYMFGVALAVNGGEGLSQVKLIATISL